MLRLYFEQAEFLVYEPELNSLLSEYRGLVAVVVKKRLSRELVWGGR